MRCWKVAKHVLAGLSPGELRDWKENVGIKPGEPWAWKDFWQKMQFRQLKTAGRCSFIMMEAIQQLMTKP